MRKDRLRQIKKEQKREDQLALIMTEVSQYPPSATPANHNTSQEQRESLFRSFKSVKTVFSDLDGLSWAKPQRCRPRVCLVTSTDAQFRSSHIG
jgi:hypothetical protein